MSSVTESNLGLNYGWAYGESGWNTGMDDNLVKLGFTSRNQVKGILSAPPSAPSNGDAYIVGTSPTGLFSGNFGKVAIWDRTVWLFLTPKNHEVVYNAADGCDYKYDNGWSLKQEDELSPYVKVKDFTFSTGYTITDQKQCLLNLADDKYYQWFGALPKVIPAGSIPATAGGIGPLLWVDRSNLTLRTDLPTTFGADFIPSLTDVYFAFDLDTTGTTDETATIAALYAKYDVIKLPAGTIKANIHLPNNGGLIGSGAPYYASGAWQNGGTLIIGNVDFSSRRGCFAFNFSVDNYASGGNGLTGLTPTTENHYIKKVNTRANNHGHLWEQNGTSASGYSGGNILVEDCNHWGGPNGFVTKMKNVTFIRCYAYDVTAQAHVAVSDNTNGANTYSRATNCSFIDCGGNNCQNGLRVYSSDNYSTNNANNVQPTNNIKWIRGIHTNVIGSIVATGNTAESAAAGGYTNVLNDDFVIEDGIFYGAPTAAAVNLRCANRPQILGSPLFSSNTTNISFGNDLYAPYLSPSIKFVDGFDGDEARVKTVATNSASINLISRPDIVIFSNTVATTVTTISGMTGIRNYRVKFKITDAFTVCSFTGVKHSGKGVTFDAIFDGNSWYDLGTSPIVSQSQYTNGAGAVAAAVFDLSQRTFNNVWVANGVNITSVTLANNSNIYPGQKLSLTITNSNAAPITITGWDAAIKWPTEIAAPTALAAFSKLYVELHCFAENTFVATSKVTYV